MQHTDTQLENTQGKQIHEKGKYKNRIIIRKNENMDLLKAVHLITKLKRIKKMQKSD